jgi:hypothetical protein
VTTATKLTVPALLDGAVDVIGTRGFHQDSYRPRAAYDDPRLLGTCPLCVLAAISVAAGEDPAGGPSPVTLPAMVALAEHLEIDLSPYDTYHALRDAVVELVGAWNDAPERGRDDVIAALRGAAEAEREGERC